MEIRLFSRRLLLPFAAFLLIAVAELPSSSKATTSNTPPPPHHLTDSRALDLRAGGSQLVVETIEDALRQGGLALFEEGFQLDSSLNWVFGETIEGEVDVVVPLWNRNGHVIFAQPGVVFWTGLGEEERTDANLGLVYRTGLASTPLGIDAVGGASLFYDYDFKSGHRRAGFGADVQSGIFHGALNYYHPLTDTQDGREIFVEDALRGMDFRVALERNAMRVSANLGYWRFEGDEEVKGDWKSSYGFDAGIRIVPGMFLEGGWERHDENVSLDRRWNAGLAFRFSLPGFEGESYGDGGLSSNLWKPVEREKRILYEERLGISRVNIPGVTYADAEDQRVGAVAEGNTATVMVDLGKPLAEDVTLNIMVAETSTAVLGTDFSYGRRVYVLDAATGGQSAPADATECMEAMCPVSITAGVTRFDIEADILEDSIAREIPKFIDFQVEVPDAHAGLLRGSSVERITLRGHGNTVEFASTASMLNENRGMVDVAVNANLASPAPITLNISATSTDAVEGRDYMISPGRLTIPANPNGESERVSVRLTGINNDRGEGNKTIELAISGSLPDGWNFGPVTDPANPPSSITHSVTLLDDDLAVGFATPGDGDAFNPVRIFEENPTNGMQQSVTVRVESTQAAPSGGLDLAWEVMNMEGDDQVTSTSGDIDFLAGDEHKEFTLMIDNDSTQEGETPVTVRLSTPTSLPTGWEFGVQEYTFTIETSDSNVTFSDSTTEMITADEGDTLTFEMVIENIVAPSTGLGIRIAFNEGNTAAGEDLRFEETIIIPAGQSRQSFTVEVIDDVVAEGTEVYNLSLNQGASQGVPFPNGWGVVGGSRVITINPNDTIVSFASPTATALEGVRVVDTLLSVTPPPTTKSGVPFTLGGDAEFGKHYTIVLTNSSGRGSVGFANGLMDYAANETGVKVGVLAYEDDDNIVDETVTITIDESRLPPGWEIGDHGVLTVTLEDNEIPGEVSIVTGDTSKTSVTAREGGTAFVTVGFSPALPAEAMVQFRISGSYGDSLWNFNIQRPAGTSFVGDPRILTAPAGATEVFFAGLVFNDADTQDGDIVFTIEDVTVPPGWTVGSPSTHTISVEDDD